MPIPISLTDKLCGIESQQTTEGGHSCHLVEPPENNKEVQAPDSAQLGMSSWCFSLLYFSHFYQEDGSLKESSMWDEENVCKIAHTRAWRKDYVISERHWGSQIFLGCTHTKRNKLIKYYQSKSSFQNGFKRLGPENKPSVLIFNNQGTEKWKI